MRTMAFLSAAALLAMPALAAIKSDRLPDYPDPLGVAAPVAGISGGALLVGGGANFPNGFPWEGGKKVWHDAVFALAPGATNWMPAGKLPRALGYAVTLTTPGGVLVAGGSDADRHYADCFLLKWDGAQLAIEPLPPLPIPVANACGALLGGQVIVAGGESAPGATAALTNAWSLELATPGAGWKALPAWPGPARSLPAAGVQGGRFILVGGVELTAGPDGKPARRYLNDAYAWDPRGAAWKKLADLPNPVAAAPSPLTAVGPSHLYVMGGDDGSKYGFQPVQEHPGFAPRVLAYHTITDTWVTMGELPACRVTVPAVSWQGATVIPSGEMRPGVRSPEVIAHRAVSPKAGFGWINYTTLFLYLCGMMGIGVYFMSRNKSTDDFFRGGQRIPWWAAGLSIFATMLSSITFMAIPAKGYGEGWNLFVANTYLLLTPLVTLVYLPFYRRLNVTSAYEYLERRFNLAARLIASTLFILFQCGRIAVVLLLPALALATVSNFDVDYAIILMGVLCILYTMMGGIQAVIWTDVVQAIVLMGGAAWALVTILLRVDGGVGGVIDTAAAHGKFFETLPWTTDLTLAGGWIIMLGSIFSNLFSYTASQDVVQRYVTTADRKSAARAVWTNALVSPVAQALFFAIGTALFAFYRQHPERLDPTIQTDRIFPLFIVNELPVGVAGIIVAGIFAAAQSTLSSSLNSVATAYVTDFHKRLRPQTTDQACLRLAQVLTGVIGVLGTVAALWLAHSNRQSLWDEFLKILGLFGGTVSGLFALGIFSRRANGAGALVGALAGAGVVAFIAYGTKLTFWTYAIAGVTVCVVVGWLASRLLPGSGAPDGLSIHTLKREEEA